MTKDEIMKALGAEPEENAQKVHKCEIFEPNKEMIMQLTDALRIEDPEEQFAKLSSILSVGFEDNPDIAEAMKTHAILFCDASPRIFERFHFGITFSEKGYMTFGIKCSQNGIVIVRQKKDMEEGLKLTPWTDGFSVEKLVALIDEERKEIKKLQSDAVLIREEVVADAIIKTMGGGN